MVRKKFAGQGERVDEKEKRFVLLFSFFLVHLHVLVIL
jgi:hypothetical protein